MTSHTSRGTAAPVPVLAPRGDVDIEVVPSLQAQAGAALAEHGALILDAGGIEFADSSFLRLVLTLHAQGEFRIASPSVAIQRLLEVVGADAFLSIHPSVNAARRGHAG
ncbi:STAS domain-containing protein [Streptomyces sp. SID9124]|uniref:STAS domain-containing protein n=1 Tax=Streptomyces sp. SID9124 TaxID=2706108 RepID=UPI0013DE96A3|nr:STAS domain-containing protein [Streptomyces sp. SID9124]NED12997.1 STAS domain-containing protein [Streptomyces sp. SID9124]